ncbi:hypothetical protein SAMN05216474_1711 [Lishizhenia tianjinensis]|uniref:DUF6089 domain-containing protein n=1 Tax=Lishizhenia tianjinensis TaxID=477690 RepID=A0A1I6ZXW2_9FLAO|nr:DUF6089 family protein [Lishizhenia tianjinensis]SFT67489.1 hypothetical protein SAMN05216474_1711 [Lishizhenia tianjinensis]
MNQVFRIITFLLLLVVVPLKNYAQHDHFWSKSELGFTVGGSYYIGDLNRFGHFNNSNLSGGLIFRHNYNSRVALRVSLTYGKVEAYDSLANNDYQLNRNLSFESTIFEGAVGFEFNYFNYKIGNKKYYATPFMFAQVGMARINPKAELNGELHELQPLGTEGQGTELNGNDYYSRMQLVVPMGFGFKINLGEKAAVNIQYGIRKTFTDYLDDVGDFYVDNIALGSRNGDLSAAFADRSATLNPAGSKRGNPNTKDWYSTFGIGLSFKLGSPRTCSFRTEQRNRHIIWWKNL